MEIFWLDAFIVIVRLNEVWKKDFRMRPIKCIYYSTCNSKNPLKHTRYTHTHTRKSKGEGFVRAHKLVEGGLGVFLTSCTGIAFLSLSYLPVLVRTTMALAQHLKDASTAPTATASEGSRVSCECLLSSSNSCLWKVAASASRAIWVQSDHEGGGLYFQSYQKMCFSTTTHSAGRDWHHRAAPPLVPQSNLSSFRSAIL